MKQTRKIKLKKKEKNGDPTSGKTKGKTINFEPCC